MKIIRAKDKVKTILARYNSQYKDRSFRLATGVTAGEISDALRALTKPTVKAVEEILNTSWTRTWCDECGKSCLVVLQLGEDPDYESSTINICKPCFKNAMQLFL